MSRSVGVTAVISATLQRTDGSTNWGFRLRGGADYGSDIIIEKVIVGSLADRCGLRPGDIVKAISGDLSSNMRHEDAHAAILRAGNILKLELERQAYDETRPPAYEDDDRATASSVSWTRSGGSKARSPYPANEASSNAAESYDTRSDEKVAKDRTETVPVIRVGLKPASYAPPWRQQSSGKLYERPKEVIAVVDELKQHREAVDSRSPVEEEPTTDNVQSATQEPVTIRPSVWCPTKRQPTQSKSFLLLQSMLESGEEDPKIQRPTPQWHAPVSPDYFSPPPVKSESGDRLDPTKPAQEKEDQAKNSEDSTSPAPISQPLSASTAASRTAFPFVAVRAAPANEFAPPIVPVPRRSPGPRPLSLTSPLPSQPRAFRPGAAVRSAAANPASRIAVCHRCSRNIRGPFVVALDKTWCPEHFLCDKCGCDMIDMGFVETPDGHIYCEDDYGRYIAPRCHRCRQPIIGTIVKALSAEWHTDCFTCAHCNKSIAGGLFHVEDGKPYCEKDYADMFQTKCKGCDFPIEPGDRWVEAAGENYHVTCFACTTCQCSLANRGFVMRNGKPYCTPHARGF